MCSDLHTEVENKTINEIGIRRKTGVNIIGFKTPEGNYILNPAPDTPVSKGSKLFVLGTKEGIGKVKSILQTNR